MASLGGAVPVSNAVLFPKRLYANSKRVYLSLQTDWRFGQCLDIIQHLDYASKHAIRRPLDLRAADSAL